MRIAVVVFPGSNCDQDCYFAFRNQTDAEVSYVWHQDESLDGYQAAVLPGGFSYGDYLRAGAIARFSPIMNAVSRFAADGGLVLGICNGFQILCEAGLLPGALVKNVGNRFRCETRAVRVERSDTHFTRAAYAGETLQLPIAHGEGRYYADPETLAALEEHRQVVFRYVDDKGEATPYGNPNGSLNNIAGIMNREGNVLGMMPHPERNADPNLGNGDGRKILLSLVESVGERMRRQPVR